MFTNKSRLQGLQGLQASQGLQGSQAGMVCTALNSPHLNRGHTSHVGQSTDCKQISHEGHDPRVGYTSNKEMKVEVVMGKLEVVIVVDIVLVAVVVVVEVVVVAVANNGIGIVTRVCSAFSFWNKQNHKSNEMRTNMMNTVV